MASIQKEESVAQVVFVVSLSCLVCMWRVDVNSKGCGLSVACSFHKNTKPQNYFLNSLEAFLLNFCTIEIFPEARSSLLANPHHILESRVWKNFSCETVVSAAWFQLLQVTSLAAVTTGRTGVKILVSFWPEHSLRSDLRAPNFKLNFPWGACPPDSPSLYYFGVFTCTHQ